MGEKKHDEFESVSVLSKFTIFHPFFQIFKKLIWFPSLKLLDNLGEDAGRIQREVGFEASIPICDFEGWEGEKACSLQFLFE